MAYHSKLGETALNPPGGSRRKSALSGWVVCRWRSPRTSWGESGRPPDARSPPRAPSRARLVAPIARTSRGTNLATARTASQTEQNKLDRRLCTALYTGPDWAEIEKIARYRPIWRSMRSCRSKCNVNRGGRPRRARACICALRNYVVMMYNNNVAIVTACVSTKLSYDIKI